MESLEKNKLGDRTRLRNSSLWVPLDWGGLMNPLVVQQAVLDTLARPMIENPMAVSDENWGVKEFQRDRTAELEQAAISQDIRLADAKVATGRAKLAIQKAVDEYTLAAEVFDAKVRSLLMSAREYAALVELKLLAVERSQTTLAIQKEGLHLEQVQADTFKEAIAGAMVEADIAKAKLDVAKANVRAVLAEVSAGEAEVKAAEGQIQEVMAKAEKAGLQASVAMIYAEILTKKLSVIKLDVEQKEITAGFGFLQSRLDDALALYDAGALIEMIKTEGEAQIQAEIDLILAAEKVTETLRKQAVDDAKTALKYKETETAANLKKEEALRNTLLAIETKMSNARLGYFRGKEQAQTFAQATINSAHRGVYRGSSHYLNEVKRSTELID